ncbi:hypothetical protein, partial [Collinsella tanakaei]|uniref:hypothetical protein n=1 Tax=Collinsella tanakaei TaxID=626935 RepID=UPI00195A3543
MATTKRAEKIVKSPRARKSGENLDAAEDRLFLDEYFANGGNATQAEPTMNPDKKYMTAASCASNRLKRIRATTTWA